MTLLAFHYFQNILFSLAEHGNAYSSSISCAKVGANRPAKIGLFLSPVVTLNQDSAAAVIFVFYEGPPPLR